MTWARRVAWEILLKVERGAHATDLLDRGLAQLETRDAHLVTEIVLGVLRRRAQLDWLIERQTGRAAAKLDLEVLTALRMGLYQRLFLSRIPAHAAIDESVELVKRARKRSAAGFVNAVLRKVARAPAEWPAEPVRWSLPEWLWERWKARFGQEVAEGIARKALERPVSYVRHSEPFAGLEATAIPGCYRVTGEAPAGARHQDIGSQSIVPLLLLETGQSFLDVCAAPGNKTRQALESGVWAVACDASRQRLYDGLLEGVDRVQADAAIGLPFGLVFDRVLVDVPCSGTGTLARNPEIRWRLTPADLLRHQQRQILILRNAMGCLKPGGKLVYSTCSLEAEENEAVLELAGVGRVESIVHRIPGKDLGEGFFAAVLFSG